MKDKTKVYNPLDNIFNFCKWMVTGPTQFSSFNVRGNMISIYLPEDEMLYYANLLQSRGYSSNDSNNIWLYKGYAKGGYYFNVGPYHIRIAKYGEKIHNQQDVKYIQQQHQDEIGELKKQITELQEIINKAKQALL